MRLLHSSTLDFHEFPNHKDVAYAILSHTWGDDEVLFQELDGFNAETTPEATKQKSGYKKIKACCAQAASDGFEYAWVDTCCIDKRSSAELSEAINSMYRWYQDSAVCYAYLADVPNDADLRVQRKKFRDSRWFRRGWTLQELIAPCSIEFYGDHWFLHGQDASLGTRRSLTYVVAGVTRIPIDVLQGSEISSYSVAQKMCWAATRETTREEDLAYCLMGLFEVNMPLLYGEGNRAFYRLQEEIMKVSADETIFAWKIPRSDTKEFSRGILAKSPNSFASCASTIQDWGLSHDPRQTTPFSVTNMGLRLEVTLIKLSDFGPEIKAVYMSEDQLALQWQLREFTMYVAVLKCYFSNPRKLVGVLLCCRGDGRIMGTGPYVRIDSGPYGGLVFLDADTFQPSDYKRTIIFAAITERASTIVVQDNSYTPWSQAPSIWLRGVPQDLTIVGALPTDFIKITDSPPLLILASGSTRLGTYSPPLKIAGTIEGMPQDQVQRFWLHSSAIVFADVEDSFIVCIKWDGSQLCIELSHYFPGMSIDPNFETKVVPEHGESILKSAAKGNDRSSYALGSGRVAHASLRPQKVGGSIGYGLYITVSPKRTE